MDNVRITILDTDTAGVQRAARRLRILLKNEGVCASVREVSCYLEISRQGLRDRVPVIQVDTACFCCRNLEEPLLAEFAHRLARTVTER